MNPAERSFRVMAGASSRRGSSVQVALGVRHVNIATYDRSRANNRGRKEETAAPAGKGPRGGRVRVTVGPYVGRSRAFRDTTRARESGPHERVAGEEPDNQCGHGDHHEQPQERVGRAGAGRARAAGTEGVSEDRNDEEDD